jgi:murein DD-endopeptidase MepM/ murein hydrolase activator NlpD
MTPQPPVSGSPAASSISSAPQLAPQIDLSTYRTAYLTPPVVAAAPAQPATRTTGFVWPVVGPITQLFGVPELGVGAPHTGIDIAQAAGSPVRAAQAGRVVFAGGDPCCDLGYWVEINHGNRYSTRYGHLMRPPTVLAGAYVSQGQVIGFSGNTGFSTGPHLHFEVRFDGVPINPLALLPGGSLAPLDLGR